MKYIVGIDLGQAKDYTAIVVIERRPQKTGDRRVDWVTNEPTSMDEYVDHFFCGRIERPELNTPYTKIVDHIQKLLKTNFYKGDCVPIVDMTGVGRPVVDMMRNKGIYCEPVTITAGEKETYDSVSGCWNVPKKALVTTMRILAEQKRLTYASGLKYADQLRKELENFKVRITKNANATFGAEGWREGDHDDLVLAMSLACWWGNKNPSDSWWPSERPPEPGTPEFWQLKEEKILRQHMERVREERVQESDDFDYGD